MKKYKYAELSRFTGMHVSSVGIFCTDPKLIEEVNLEMKKMAPQAKISIGKNSVHMKDTKNEHEIYQWLITYLCHEGWEPFSAESDGPAKSSHYRFVYDE